jgi:hypothetical protein
VSRILRTWTASSKFAVGERLGLAKEKFTSRGSRYDNEPETLLSAVPLAIALGGCLTDSQNAQSEPETDEPDPSEDLFMSISNERSEQISVSLTVMDTNRSPIAEKSTMLDPAEGVEVYTGITETGEYPSVFSLNGEQSSIRTT